MKVAFFSLAFLFVFASFASAEEGAGAFLDLGVGARAVGMGGAFGSIADDGSSFYWNPAGLANLRFRDAAFMYASLFGLAEPLGSYHVISFAQPLQGGATISLAWIRLSVNDIPRFPELEGGDEKYTKRLTDSLLQGDGEPVGFFSDQENAFYFSFAKMNKFDLDFGWEYFIVPIEIPVGVNLKLIRSSLAESSARGIGLDMGAMVRFGVGTLFDWDVLGDVSFALLFQDIANTAITWDTRHQDEIPFSVKFGFAYLQPIPSLQSRFSLSFESHSKDGARRRLGFEYWFDDRVALRGGRGEDGLSVGAGLALRRTRVDYAFVPHDLGGSHRISGGIRF